MQRGELASDALVRLSATPVRPLLVSLLWETTFEPFEKLDVAGLLAAHRELLIAPDRQREPPP